MVLHVLYRLYGGENDKPRPVGYSKAACFRSLLTSLDELGEKHTMTVVADGSVPPEIVPLIRPDAAVVQITAGRASTSMRRALDVAIDLARQASPDDMFWICEDDYVYRRGAMRHLSVLRRSIGWSDYVTLFVPAPSDWHETHRSQPEVVVPADRVVAQDGLAWNRIGSTTSTFGLSQRALLRDRRTLMIGTAAGAPWDCSTWATLQGIRPYPWRHILADLDPRVSLRGLAKVPAKPLMRVVMNVLAFVHIGVPRTLRAPARNLAVHAETYEVPDLAAWSR